MINMENQKEQTLNIELRTTDNAELKTAPGEFRRLYMTIEINREDLDSVVAYANIIGMEPDKLFEKSLHSGIKSLRNSMQSFAHTSIPDLIKRFAPVGGIPDAIQPVEDSTPSGS